MNITATETHRIGQSVHVAVTDDAGKDIYPGGRYVSATEWDEDAEQVVAKIAEYLAAQQPASEPVAPARATPCRMTDAEVTTKLEAMAAAKAAEEANGQEEISIDPNA